MLPKRILVSGRLRRPPAEGFSWVDRRFVRDHAETLSHDAIVVYFFLAAVSDKHGLSFWSDSKIGCRLKLDPEAVARARGELVTRDLVAHASPLTQVLSLGAPRLQRSGGEASHVGDILRRLGGRAP